MYIQKVKQGQEYILFHQSQLQKLLARTLQT